SHYPAISSKAPGAMPIARILATNMTLFIYPPPFVPGSLNTADPDNMFEIIAGIIAAAMPARWV
ncbi:MAG: hypothetical protein WCA63_11485, partial [Gallionella sp.]